MDLVASKPLKLVRIQRFPEGVFAHQWPMNGRRRRFPNSNTYS